MIRQSQANILLTRPQDQSERFAQDLGLPVVISPLMAPDFLTPPQVAGHFAAVVLSSETGVEAARRISALGQALPDAACCVGRRTAAAAEHAGFSVVMVEPNMAALVQHITAIPPQGRLLILRPEDSTADTEVSLNSAGVETVSLIIYRQKQVELNALATQLLHQDAPVVVPLFSPRSARLFAEEYRRIKGRAPLYCVAISPATAAAFDLAPQEMRIASKPNGARMCIAVQELLKDRLGS